MAEDIIIRYRAEVDELKSQLRAIIEQNEDLADEAIRVSDVLQAEQKVQAKANEARIAQIKKLKKELESLERARKSAFEPAEIADYDKQIKQVTKDIQTLKNGTTEVRKNNSLLGGSFRGLGVAIAAAFTVDSVIGFAKQSIKAFEDAEKSAKDLTFAVRGINEESEQALASLQRQAEELSGATKSIFTKQDIQDTQTQLAQYGILGDEIEKLIPLILDYASAQDITLSQATRNVISAIDGQGRALQQVGIDIDSTATEYERYNQLLVDLAKFTGKAEEETKTLEGQQAALSKNIKEVSERIGETLVPVLQQAQLGLLNVVDAGIDFFKLFSKEGRTQSQFSNIAELAGIENAREIGEGLQELGFTTSFVTKENEGLVKSLGETLVNLEDNTDAAIKNAKSQQDLRDQYDLIIKAREKVVSLQKDEAISDENASKAKRLLFNELIKVQGAIDNFTVSVSKALTAQDLQGKSLGELNSLLEKFKNDNTSIARSNAQLIEDEIEKRNKAFEEWKKLQEQRYREALRFIEQQKKLDDEATQEEIDNDKEVTENFIRELERRTKETQEFFDKEARASEIRARDFVAASTKGLDTRGRIENARGLLGLTEEDRKRELAALEEDFDKGLILEADYYIKREEITTKFANRRIDLLEQLGVTEADLIRSNAEIWITENQLILDSTVGLINQLQSLFSGFFSNRTAQLNRESEIYQEQLARQQDALQESRNQRLITESEYQEGLGELNKKEEESRRKLAEEQAKIAKKQALFEKASALATLAIETAQAVAQIQLNAAIIATNPLLPPGVAQALAAVARAQVPIVLGFSAAQAAVIAAQPLPKFAKGTKGKKDSGMAIVGEEGPEMTFLPQGSKVLPAKQTKTYGAVFDAMYDNRFDDYVLKEFVTPALQEQKRKYEQVQNERFADNVAHSITVSNSGLYWDLENIRKKGQRVVNADDIGRAVAKEVGKVIQSRRRQ